MLPPLVSQWQYTGLGVKVPATAVGHDLGGVKRTEFPHVAELSEQFTHFTLAGVVVLVAEKPKTSMWREMDSTALPSRRG